VFLRVSYYRQIQQNILIRATNRLIPFFFQAQPVENLLDNGEPAKETYMNNDTQNKKPVHDKGDLDLSGKTVTNNVGQIHSPPREGVKFSGKFICG
jgi:hypothetical protein